MTSFLADPSSIPLKPLTSRQDEGPKTQSKAKEKDDLRKGAACGRQFKVDEKPKVSASIPLKVLLHKTSHEVAGGTHFPTTTVAGPSLISFSPHVTSMAMAIPGRQSCQKQVQTESEQNLEDEDDETLIIGSPPSDRSGRIY